MNQDDILMLFQNVIDQPLLLALLIILASFILEDLATAAAALITAQTDVHFMIPFSALFIGIILGDIGLYGIGKYSAHFVFLKKFVAQDKVHKLAVALDKNLILAIFTSRFIPGMRLPTYMAMGVFEIWFKRFLSVVIVAVGLWSGASFYLFYLLGDSAEHLFGMYKWYALTFIVFIVVLGPKIYRRLRG